MGWVLIVAIAIASAVGASVLSEEVLTPWRRWTGDARWKRLVGIAVAVGVLAGAAIVVELSRGTSSNGPTAPLAAEAVLGEDIQIQLSTVVRLAGEPGSDGWVRNLDVAPGAVLEVGIWFLNDTDQQLNSVMVGLNRPDASAGVDGTTRLENGNHSTPIALTNENISAGGINVGGYGSRSSGLVTTQLQVDGPSSFRCGRSVLAVDGVVRSGETDVEIISSAAVTVVKVCS